MNSDDLLRNWVRDVLALPDTPVAFARRQYWQGSISLVGQRYWLNKLTDLTYHVKEVSP